MSATHILTALITNLNLADALKAPRGGCAQKGGELTPLGLPSQAATTPNLWNSSSLATTCSTEQQGHEMTSRCHSFSHSGTPDLSRTADSCKGSAAAQGSCGTVLSPPVLYFSRPSKNVNTWGTKKAVTHDNAIPKAVTIPFSQVLSTPGIKTSKKPQKLTGCFCSSLGNIRKD